MKCSLCKFKNAALEAERHPNAVTIFITQSLHGKLRENRQRVCVEHDLQDIYSKDLEIGNKAYAKATENGYLPMDKVWNQPIWIPKGERE